MIGRERFVITVPNVLEAVFFYRCNYVFWFLYNLIIFVYQSRKVDTKKILFQFLFSNVDIRHIFADKGFSKVDI